MNREELYGKLDVYFEKSTSEKDKEIDKDCERISDFVTEIGGEIALAKKALKDKDCKKAAQHIKKIRSLVEDMNKFQKTIDKENYAQYGRRILAAFLQVSGTLGVLYNAFSMEKPFGRRLTGSAIGGVAAGIGKNIKPDINYKDVVTAIEAIVNEATRRCDEMEKALAEIMADKDDDVKESVDSIKLNIYESAASGEISDEERDLLLSMI